MPRTKSVAVLKPNVWAGKVPKQVTEAQTGSSSKRRHRPGTKALQEIRQYQKSTDLLIPRTPFARLVREITERLWPTGQQCRYTIQALLSLQTSAEAYIVGLFEDSVLCAIHARRITVQVKDVHLARRLRGRPI